MVQFGLLAKRGGVSRTRQVAVGNLGRGGVSRRMSHVGEIRLGM